MAKSFRGVREIKYRNQSGKVTDIRFSIRYTRNGKQYEEIIGRKSEGFTAEKAYEILKELKQDIKTGRALSLKDKIRPKEALERSGPQDITFADFFEKRYFPHIQFKNRKSTVDREVILFEKWLKGYFGHLPLSRISPDSLVSVLTGMKKVKLANRTQHYAIALTRQVFNYAIQIGQFTGNNPASRFQFTKEDNQRIRYLTKEEIDLLLNELKGRSEEVYLMALLSVDCGLRAGEIFKLTWADVNLGDKTLSLRQTKNKKNRTAFMTNRVWGEMSKLKPHTGDEFVFKARNGGQIQHVSRTFERAVKATKLNKGISNRCNKVVFHTLRHTYASRLVQKGISLYEVKELLGHSDIKMTMRYSHLSPEGLRNAVSKLDE